MDRHRSPEVDKLIGVEFKVLNKGYISLVEYLGSDKMIVNAARVSYQDGTKIIRKDEGLIRYLMENAHTSPFEQVVLAFNIKLPMFVARQWVRHRTARLNEISARYSVLPDDFYIPELDQIRLQSQTNKQGRSEEVVENPERIVEMMKKGQQEAYKTYLYMLEQGVAKEIARSVLPVSIYTQWYWQIDLHNLFHFLKLRMDHHAQYEIRVYANEIAKIAKAVAPHAYQAFEDYILNSLRLSRREKTALGNVMKGLDPGLEGKELDKFNNKLEAIKSS